MDEKLAEYIADKLKELGYKNVEVNCGTVWYEDADGETWSLCPQPCVLDEIDQRDRKIEDLTEELDLERGLL